MRSIWPSTGCFQVYFCQEPRVCHGKNRRDAESLPDTRVSSVTHTWKHDFTVWPLMLEFIRKVIHGCTCTYWQWTYAVVAGKDTDVCCVLTSGINNLFWNNNVEKKKRCQSAADTVWQAGWSLGSAVEKLHSADRSSVHLLPRQLTSGSRTFVWSQFK